MAVTSAGMMLFEKLLKLILLVESSLSSVTVLLVIFLCDMFFYCHRNLVIF